ncbi:MAG: hypothetical protein ACREIB_13645 [Pseudomonadota bacterium]
MRLRLFILSFALANLTYSGIQQAMTAQSEPRLAVLSGEDMKRILPGHTLVAFDETGPFWVYFPDPDTVWGQSSAGDVDIGRWWIEDGRYCRAWRRWHDGASRCWLLASYGADRIVWMDGQQAIQGESLVQSGNTIAGVWPPLLALVDTDVEAAAVTAASEPQAPTESVGREPAGNAAQRGSGSDGGSKDSASSASSSERSSSAGSSPGISGGSGNGSGKGEGASAGKGGKGDKGDRSGRGGGNGGKGGGKN